MSSGGQLRRLLFGIRPDQVRFERRGFAAATPAIRERLESVGTTFLAGYHHALEESRPVPLARRLDEVDVERRGWAYEGAAMALALLDRLTPWRRDRVGPFLAGPADPHLYMAHVGIGWALARLRRRVEPALVRLDPLLGWLAVDGYGFHEGYFRWRRHLAPGAASPPLRGYAARVFDQGLGRSLWFVRGADVEAIATTIEDLEPARHADLYSGVGLACAYAGGADADHVEALRVRAGAARGHLAQGAAFAAQARRRAGNPAPHTETACRILCDRPADAAAAVTDAALDGLAADGATPAYEVWRERIRARLSPQEVAA
jgi:hypothetical protein